MPLTKSGQDQRYADTFNPVLNLTSTAVTLRMYAPGATGGSLLIYLSDTNSTSGTGATVPLTDINKGWKDVKFDVGGAGGSFNPAQIKQVTIEVTSTNSGPWTNPTIIYIDGIRDSASAFDDTFDSSLGGMVKSSAVVVAGSTLAWSNSIP